MQQRFGVATGLSQSLERQLRHSLVGRALEVTDHGSVEFVSGIFPVHLGGRVLEGFLRLGPLDYNVVGSPYGPLICKQK